MKEIQQGNLLANTCIGAGSASHHCKDEARGSLLSSSCPVQDGDCLFVFLSLYLLVFLSLRLWFFLSFLPPQLLYAVQDAGCFVECMFPDIFILLIPTWSPPSETRLILATSTTSPVQVLKKTIYR